MQRMVLPSKGDRLLEGPWRVLRVKPPGLPSGPSIPVSRARSSCRGGAVGK